MCLPANIFFCLRQRSQVQSNRSQIWIVGYAYDIEDDRQRSIKPEVVAMPARQFTYDLAHFSFSFA